MENKTSENADEVSRHFSFLNKELLEQDWKNLVKHYGVKKDDIPPSVTPPLAQSTSKNEDAIAFENLQRFYNASEIGGEGRWPTTRWKSSNTDNYFSPFRRSDANFGATRYPHYEDKMETYKLVSSDRSKKPGRPSKFCMMVMCLLALLFLIGIASISTIVVLRPSEEKAEAQSQSESIPSTMAPSPNISSTTLPPEGRTTQFTTTTQLSAKTTTKRHPDTTTRQSFSQTTVPDINTRSETTARFTSSENLSNSSSQSDLPSQHEATNQQVDTTTMYYSKTTVQLSDTTHTITESDAITQSGSTTQSDTTQPFDASTQSDKTEKQSDPTKQFDITTQGQSDRTSQQSKSTTQPTAIIKSDTTTKQRDTTTQSEITTLSDTAMLTSTTTQQSDTKTRQSDITTIQSDTTSRFKSTKQSDSSTQPSNTTIPFVTTTHSDTTTKQFESTRQPSDMTTQQAVTITQKSDTTSRSDTTTQEYDRTSQSSQLHSTIRQPDIVTRFDSTTQSQSTTRPLGISSTESDTISKYTTILSDTTTQSTTEITTPFDTTTKSVSTTESNTKSQIYVTTLQQSDGTTQNDPTADATTKFGGTQSDAITQTTETTKQQSDTSTQFGGTQSDTSTKRSDTTTSDTSTQSNTTPRTATKTQGSDITTQQSERSDITTQQSDITPQSDRTTKSDITTEHHGTIIHSDTTTQQSAITVQFDTTTQPFDTTSILSGTTPQSDSTVKQSESTTQSENTTLLSDATTKSHTTTTGSDITTQQSETTQPSGTTTQSYTTVKQSHSTTQTMATTQKSDSSTPSDTRQSDSTADSSDIPIQPDTTTEDSRTTTSLPEYILDLSFSKSNYSFYFGEENPIITCLVEMKKDYPHLIVLIENERGLISQTNLASREVNVYSSSVRFEVVRRGDHVTFDLEMLNYTCSDKGIYTCSASYQGYQNISVDIELFIPVRPRLKLPNYLIDGKESTEFSCTVEEGSSVSWSIQFKNGTLISPFAVNQNMVANSDDVYCNLKSATFSRTFTVSMNDTTLCCNSRYGKQVDQACTKLYVLEKTYCKGEMFSYKSFPYDCFLAVFCFSENIQITDQCVNTSLCFDEDSRGCNRAPPNGAGNPYSCISKPDNHYIPIKGKCTEYNVCARETGFQHTCPTGQYFTNDQNKPCSTDMSESCT